MSDPTAIPATGRPVDDIMAEIDAERSDDLDWRGGKAFSLVYNAADPELDRLHHAVAGEYLHDNALNPFAYPTLLRMERELVSMAAGLLGGRPRAGALTSGGTESIFCAVQTARDVGRDRGVTAPNVLVPATAHPAFSKAGHYLGVDVRRIEVGSDGRADLGATAEAIDDDTVLLVGSAPCYPYGLIDPITDLAALAADNDRFCHVDACLGGWLLPFWEELGEPVPAWNLAVPGVTSLSADIHKYGYTYKGASVILYADRDVLERQHFIFDDWPGGLYASATTAGTRPAPPIAGAWATLQHLGHDGLLDKARVVRDATRAMLDGIAAIGDLHTVHEPEMSVACFTSATRSIGAIGDVMDDRGWHLDRQQEGLHLMVSPGHAAHVDQFLTDLAAAFDNHGEARDSMAAYSGTADG
ncbi:MAG: aminotransferase class V-fold PLP-dependent enzyme [Acidimicrobiia bacterium]|nr:aminotransferase class V-fold PLP-dependent enzyme [Acidimicrobiia bacterium]